MQENDLKIVKRMIERIESDIPIIIEEIKIFEKDLIQMINLEKKY